MRPQPWLAPLGTLYGAIVHARNVAYHRGILRCEKLRAPVVSIGNLSTGGTGKTPFVIALARLLTENGMSADILSRGYSRDHDATERVDPASTAARFGDEPLLLARETQLPVYVGRSRHAAGRLAEQATDAANLHLLDDGFQHRRLHRDLDIVLLHPDDLHARMLPAGHLREPLASLRRAHVIVLREEDRALEDRLRPYSVHAAIWHMRRQVIAPAAPGRYLAFCGIARPQDFFAALAAPSPAPILNLVAQLPFPDHHRYRAIDLARLCRLAGNAGATRFVTTGKDFVRLTPDQLDSLHQTAPVEIARLETTLVEADAALNLIRSL